ncbi:hypothetical protein GYY_03020 [Methanococcus maripaludis X1]|jgi:hypothetical protein|uniref:Uncharacterized protein n=2 Tax=Methanococcus maripaludis TaxID=39152 RepID=A9A6S9_METM6|nr:hypothetical protein [Methanococcus maripaludis]AEK19483.1 hypothetical protein GYY_03020 [Methanococcus maripaludis X1]
MKTVSTKLDGEIQDLLKLVREKMENETGEYNPSIPNQIKYALNKLKENKLI